MEDVDKATSMCETLVNDTPRLPGGVDLQIIVTQSAPRLRPVASTARSLYIVCARAAQRSLVAAIALHGDRAQGHLEYPHSL